MRLRVFIRSPFEIHRGSSKRPRGLKRRQGGLFLTANNVNPRLIKEFRANLRQKWLKSRDLRGYRTSRGLLFGGSQQFRECLYIGGTGVTDDHVTQAAVRPSLQVEGEILRCFRSGTEAREAFALLENER